MHPSFHATAAPVKFAWSRTIA